MAKNLIYDRCSRVEVTAAADRTSGQFIQEEGWNGLVMVSAASGANYTLIVDGVVEVVLAAVTRGTKIYLKLADMTLTKTPAAGCVLCGVAISASTAVGNKVRMAIVQPNHPVAATQAASVAADVAAVVVDLNALIVKLKAANLMA